MRSRFLHFADADAEFDDADFVLLGIPFDATSSFRSGSRFAPNAIREASYNFETYIAKYDVDIEDIKIFDAGNVEDYGKVDDMVVDVEAEVFKILEKGAFPIVIGGEHSVSPPSVRAFKNAGREIGVLVFDAHLDFRREYLGIEKSHACASRRMSEVVGVENVVVIGVRSVCKEEFEDAKEQGLRFFSTDAIHENGIEAVVKEALGHLGHEDIYVSVDMDGLDPSFAPGVGNPEPFGPCDRDLRALLEMVGPRMCGFDIVEVCPPFDKGNTAALAARLIREVIAIKEKKP
jgi:agmatinase